MKKFVIIIALALGFAVAASAQPKAIGGQLFYTPEVSYQHYVRNSDFLQFNVGMESWTNGVRFAGTYNFVFAQPAWTPRGTWSWYAGPGVALGSTAHYESDEKHLDNGNKFFAGLTAQVGLEYQFWFNLQLAADLRPVLGISNSKFYSEGLYFGFVPCVSVRYLF